MRLVKLSGKYQKTSARTLFYRAHSAKHTGTHWRSAARSALPEGDSHSMDELLNHRYQLTKKLGQGGFGAVYQATDLTLDRQVAVKLLTFTGDEQEELTRRFITEARIASKLNHPNALIIYDFGENKADGRCFLVSELLMGESLHDRLSRGALKVPLALEVLYQICAVLSEAHKLKIVHRDIKPANIFLNDLGVPAAAPSVKLLDFGIAKIMEGKSNTVTGQMMGTPHYMSPEQIVNIKLVDHRSDIYSLGIVFYHALMGRVPFNDESYYAIMRQHMQAPMPPLVLPPEVSTPIVNALQALVTSMTTKDLRKRAGTVEEVMAAVQQVWAQHPHLARAATPSGMFAAVAAGAGAGTHTPSGGVRVTPSRPALGAPPAPEEPLGQDETAPPDLGEEGALELQPTPHALALALTPAAPAAPTPAPAP
ncbi:MAG: serine/threonine protein kinase, partial [Deltaproteobacteria bacterium]|nr:serine/threonine protein kinase [Deltaproteobacteria bacterium]